MKAAVHLLSPVLAFLLAAPLGSAVPASNEEPHWVTVQHILISFKGAIPKPTVTRSKDEAKKLAEEVFERAQKGEDFDALVKQYTDDEYPGIYRMSNKGIAPDPTRQEFAREAMVKGFGDVSFSLPVGGIGLAKYDSQNSKYGWHIIKRLE
jgi:foldase protein PrsA